MKYGLKDIKIKSNWFETGIIKEIGYKGYNLYLQLFKFYTPRQENEYTFIVSISMLRKETGYTSSEIVELLKMMLKAKIIKWNISRWDRMYENNKLLDDKLFIVWACDEPKTTRTTVTKYNKEMVIDKPNTDNDKYVSVNLDLMQYYFDLELNERCYLIHTYIKKMSNSVEGKCWVSINKMADVLGIGDNYVHKLIHEMNRKYVLYSAYRLVDGYMMIDGKKKRKKRFEHRVLTNIKGLDQFKKIFKDDIDKNVAKWNKRNNKDEIVEDDFQEDATNNDWNEVDTMENNA